MRGLDRQAGLEQVVPLRARHQKLQLVASDPQRRRPLCHCAPPPRLARELAPPRGALLRLDLRLKIRDASLSATITWPPISVAAPRACALPGGSPGTWPPPAASTRAAEDGRSRRGSRLGRGHTRRKCRPDARIARRKRDDGCRSPDPAPVRFLDTGRVSSDAPPRTVASITAALRKARGCYPGLSSFVSGLIELPERAETSNNLAPRAGRAAGDRSPAISAIMGPPEPGGDTRSARRLRRRRS